MSQPYIGEIRMFGGSFAPRGWSLCDGQLLAISQYDALFSLLGTIYGGDGRTTFGLPDMRGRVPVHQGTGPGLPNQRLGAKGGSERVTVTTGQLPSHTHQPSIAAGSAVSGSPTGGLPAAAQGDFYTGDFTAQPLHSSAMTSKGGGQSHENVQPFQCVTFIISLTGVYPS